MPKSPYELCVCIHAFLQTNGSFNSLHTGKFFCFLSSADFFKNQRF